MIEIEIDGKKMEVQPDSSVLEAAFGAGTSIPHFCYHKKLSIAASCRMCLVEVNKSPKLMPACSTPVHSGMVVQTASENVIKAQKAVMEFLLINHPLDCPICDQAGECQLQDLSMGYGAGASRFQEEKRVVFHKNVSPLISMMEMERCIHCSRCIRFGQEVAGIMEYGMLNRSDYAEIATFVGKTVDSELSGNMIDLCPVGALLSKPFRFKARSWELTSNRSVSPHDGLGSNLMVQTLNNRVMRVLPFENESINECWLSDRDRFSYEGLSSDDRLTKPMVKQDNRWIETDWQTALQYIVHGLKHIRDDHGTEALAALASPQATVEELVLLQKLMRSLGSENVDFRLRQTDFSLDGKLLPWLGMKIADVGNLKNSVIIGSSLRKDHPVLAARFRKAALAGAKIHVLHGVDDDWLMPIESKIVVAPSQWLSVLSTLIITIAKKRGLSLPEQMDGMEGMDHSPVSSEAEKIADALSGEGDKAIFLGHMAVQHPAYFQLHKAVEWIAKNTGSQIGYLTEGANTTGAYLANAIPNNGSNAQAFFTEPRKAYLLLHTEPELDCANPHLAKEALLQAEMVVVLSPFQHGHEYADVMLPVSPFTETSGTYVNCEGLAQSFQGAVPPLGETRPAWKVLRVLGNLLDLPGFDYESSEEVRDEIINSQSDNSHSDNNKADLKDRFCNFADLPPQFSLPEGNGLEAEGLERVSDVPLYFADGLVRRARSLQMTVDAKAPVAYLSTVVCEQLGIASGDRIKVSQGEASTILTAMRDKKLPEKVVRIAAGHPTTSMLGAMFGPISVERI